VSFTVITDASVKIQVALDVTLCPHFEVGQST